MRHKKQLTRLSSKMDIECDDIPSNSKTTAKKNLSYNVTYAGLPNGQRIPLLKSLLTSVCERNCYYCTFRSDHDFRRDTLKPDEMANAYMSLHNAGIVKGLFLSSGIAGGGVCTQDKLIATAEILRKKHKYRGYIHLKLMPGAEYSQVERSMQLVNRVSSNLEAPNIQRLEQLAPRKDFSVELLKPLQWVDEIRRYKTLEQDGREKRWPSMTTQFVVGPAGETDYELLKTSEYLYKDLNLSRIYYMSFRPVVNTPLEQYPPTPPYRENHLYQASFLLRDYRFKIEELPFDQSGGLPKKTDPKTAWAESNLAGSRIEINHANRQVLLRIPGIGPRSVKAIISGRKINRIKVIEDLKKIGINPTRALPYILLDGKKPPQQLPLFC